MDKEKKFNFKKVQIEKFVQAEYRKKFRSNVRISVRKRQKFIGEISRKISKKFGKEVLCLIDFTKKGFVTVLSPAYTESTDKGKLYQSFSHPPVFYTTHCLDRFSERTDTTEKCIIALDALAREALLSYGEHEGYLACSEGVFACEVENDRLIVKTFITFGMLTQEQIRKFYGPGMISSFPEEYFADVADDSDFVLSEELPQLRD